MLVLEAVAAALLVAGTVLMLRVVIDADRLDPATAPTARRRARKREETPYRRAA